MSDASEPSSGARAGAPPDVICVGAGVMGCAIAWVLAQRGARVVVLERSVPGAEASSAAAGMLGAQVESHAPGPFTSLCIASRARFGDWAARLAQATGIDVEHRVVGILRAAFDRDDADAVVAHATWQSEAGLSVDIVDGAKAREIEPALAPGAIVAAHFRDDGRVDPPRFLAALRIAAEKAGAEFRSGALVKRVAVEDGRAVGVEMESGERIEASDVVVAAGSWSTLVGGTPLAAGQVVPARGQIVELGLPSPITRGVVFGKRAYLSPRDDGRVLVGSTLEFVGYRRGVTAGAVRDLIGGAIDLLPALAGAELLRTWSSFRPYTKDELPIIGTSGTAHLWLATGHFRNGILLSPITAEIVAALVAGERPPIDTRPYELGARA